MLVNFSLGIRYDPCFDRTKSQYLKVPRSNIIFIYTVPVTSVTLTPTPITVTAGQQMSLTCTTSASYPQANITWYMSSMDITNDATLMSKDGGGLTRTISLLQSRVVKEDNRRRVYCIASNTPNMTVTSNIQSLNVLCEFTELYFLLTESSKSYEYLT